MRLAFLLLSILLASLFEPNCFRFFAGQLIRFEAWRGGITAHIGSVGGSLFEPLVLRDTVWIYESETGPITRVEIQATIAAFSWRNLLPRASGNAFQRLTFQGVTGKIQFPLNPTSVAASDHPFTFRLPRPGGHWLPAPERIEASEVDFIFQSDTDYVRLLDTTFTLSNVEAGTIRAGQILVKHPWLNRTFRDVHGTTAIQDAKVEFADLTLEPGVQVQSLSAELDDLARGLLNLDTRLAAFGGEMRIAAQTLSQERPFAFEATNNFSQINVAKLATFLGISDAAGGTIKSGYFKFRGPPQQLAKATASLRLEATNFQWESRQWDTLVLGATLVDGRVQIPELALVQGHNRLNLNGEMPLPTEGVAWWQSEFSVKIAAKIDNLTELSALMLPEFTFAAGKANIDGSISGKNQQFDGQLILSGSDLKWRNAPIEQLHASVNLNGNEFQITNVSLFNNGDYVHGRGVVNIIGDKQYWGEVRASIEDLATYAAILQKPIVPESLAGGAVIDWSGEGSAKGHSGKFSARLRKVRSLGVTAALLHPINADLDGTYAQGVMQFSRFSLSDDESSFTANVGVGNKALSLQGVRLYHKQALWLEGDALLPLDVWNAWPNTTLATLLDDQTVTKINLTANNLQLREASLLTGWKFPIEGVVSGNLVAEGPLGGLKTSGKWALNKARIPLAWSGDALTGVEGEATLEGQALLIQKLTGNHPAGDFTASGKIDFTNLRDATLTLAATSAKTALRFFSLDNSDHPSAAEAIVSANLKINGPASAASIAGDAKLLAVNLGGTRAAAPVDLAALFLESRSQSLPPVFALHAPPWNAWTFDIALRTSQPIAAQWAAPPAGRCEADLRLTGKGADPALIGTVTFRGLPVIVGRAQLQLDEAALTFRDGFPRNPSINAQARGTAFGEPFSAHVIGTLDHPMHFFIFDAPLTGKAVRAELAEVSDGQKELGEPHFGLLVPAELTGGVEVVAWAPITTPTAESPPSTTPIPPPPLAPGVKP